MANIFKTTLKKDVIADIANNKVKEIKFPLTKFWATRLTDEYNLDDKTFTFKKYDSLELSSPSNKDTNSMTFVFDHVGTYVDGDEFVVEFKQTEDVSEVDEQIEDQPVDVVVEDVQKENCELQEVKPEQDDECNIIGDSDDEHSGVFFEEDIPYISIDTVYDIVKQWVDESVLETLYNDEYVIATKARQVVVLSNGKVLGSKKTLPVNNDAEVRIEFDMYNKVYFDESLDVDSFTEKIFTTIAEIRKNNILFVWKRYTGIFMDDDGRVYFGIKYSTRNSIGFNRKYKVQ